MRTDLTPPYEDAPQDLRTWIEVYFEEPQFHEAAAVAYLESAWDQFAINDTTYGDPDRCGQAYTQNGYELTREFSVGFFQINCCSLPAGWAKEYLFLPKHNVGTAHDLWSRRGWSPWFLSATRLGLI